MTENPNRFRPIAVPLDVDDAALDRVNTQLGVPTLTKPPGRSATGSVMAPPLPATPVRAPLEKLTIELPSYVADALRREAAANRTTARHIVMLALRKNGFQVEDADLVPDGRRSKGKVR